MITITKVRRVLKSPAIDAIALLALHRTVRRGSKRSRLDVCFHDAGMRLARLIGFKALEALDELKEATSTAQVSNA